VVVKVCLQHLSIGTRRSRAVRARVLLNPRLCPGSRPSRPRSWTPGRPMVVGSAALDSPPRRASRRC